MLSRVEHEKSFVTSGLDQTANAQVVWELVCFPMTTEFSHDLIFFDTEILLFYIHVNNLYTPFGVFNSQNIQQLNFLLPF